MRRLIFFVVLIIVFSSTIVYGVDFNSQEIENFQEYNPDGKKYEFVRTYLTSLYYIKLNVQRDISIPAIDLDAPADRKKVEDLITHLVQNNVNLRVARNLIKKYKTPENGLILKTTDVFLKACDNLVKYNDLEIKLFQDLHNLQLKDQADSFDKDDFIKEQQALSDNRRRALKDLLYASMLINVVLISDKPDENGDLVILGITEEQRQKLLYKLESFYEEDYKGSVREGQTFLQGSISSIREILEDSNWDTLDG